VTPEIPSWLRQVAQRSPEADDSNPVLERIPAPDAAVREAAVLVLFGGAREPDAGGPGGLPADADVLLTQRASTLRQHSGQIAFPGGKHEDADESLAATALRECRPVDSTAASKRNVLRAVEAVAGVLGNTPSVCRKSYIHPAILDCYMDRSMEVKLSRALPPSLKRVASKLRSDEAAALRILHCMRPAAHRARAA